MALTASLAWAVAPHVLTGYSVWNDRFPKLVETGLRYRLRKVEGDMHQRALYVNQYSEAQVPYLSRRVAFYVLSLAYIGTLIGAFFIRNEPITLTLCVLGLQVIPRMKTMVIGRKFVITPRPWHVQMSYLFLGNDASHTVMKRSEINKLTYKTIGAKWLDFSSSIPTGYVVEGGIALVITLVLDWYLGGKNKLIRIVPQVFVIPFLGHRVGQMISDSYELFFANVFGQPVGGFTFTPWKEKSHLSYIEKWNTTVWKHVRRFARQIKSSMNVSKPAAFSLAYLGEGVFWTLMFLGCGLLHVYGKVGENGNTVIDFERTILSIIMFMGYYIVHAVVLYIDFAEVLPFEGREFYIVIVRALTSWLFYIPVLDSLYVLLPGGKS